MSGWLVATAASRLLSPAATSTERVDSLFTFILALSAFFFTAIVVVLIVFVIRYRRRSPGQRTSPLHGNAKIEVAWALVPGLLLLVIFAWGYRDFLFLAVAPRNAIEVRATGQKWSWTFDYPSSGITTNELTVPVGRPVKLVMSSMDVIHSFYVPAFRVKRDVLPNRYTVLWFEPLELGVYDVLCAEYCGTGHSQMLTKVHVVSGKEYQDWLDSGGGMSGEGMSTAEFGKMLFEKQGCATCHSVDGSKKVGPSMLKKYGTREQLVTGATVLVDDNYLRESMMEPNAKVVSGYDPVMPTYAGRLKEKQVNALIDYIKSLEQGQGGKP